MKEGKSDRAGQRQMEGKRWIKNKIYASFLIKLEGGGGILLGQAFLIDALRAGLLRVYQEGI
jgi:hypothetical protein